MQQTMKATEVQSSQEFILPENSPATNEDIVAYLRRSHKIAEIAAQVERETLILAHCKQYGITLTEEEVQAAGDRFRLEHKLLGSSETLAWFSQQRITVEDWSAGIRVALLTKKLKEHLFGESVDSHYLGNRNDYRRIAFSQILVHDLTDALKIVQTVQEDKAAFCALALDYAKGHQAKEKGGFAGIHFVSRLMPDIAQAISEVKEGEVVGPIETKFGYHIIKIEKRFPLELNESVREEVLDSLFRAWLQERKA